MDITWIEGDLRNVHTGESPLTVKHFLTQCLLTEPIRTRLNLPNNTGELMGEHYQVPSLNLIEYMSTQDP